MKLWTWVLGSLVLASGSAWAVMDITVPELAPASSVKRVEKKKVAEEDPFLTLTMDASRNNGIGEFRQGQPNTSFGVEPVAGKVVSKSSNTLSVSRVEFDLGASIYKNAGSSLTLGVGLPIDSVASSLATSPSGSEFGGVEFSILGSLNRSYEFKAWFADRSSSSLELYDPQYETGLGGYYSVRETEAPGLEVTLKLGPEFTVSGQPNGSATKYGPQWGARARIEADSGAGTSMHFRLFADALLRRITGIAVSGVEQGGAGLMTAVPGVEYDFLKNFWIGIAAEIPLFRPEGREGVFGNANLPGLFGATVGVRVRVSAL